MGQTAFSESVGAPGSPPVPTSSATGTASPLDWNPPEALAQYQARQQNFQQQQGSPQQSWSQQADSGQSGIVSQSQVPKERIAYILLGILFGGLGVHNFYAGYTGRAVAQLVLTVFFFWLIIPLIIVPIWVLVEVITVKQDAHGVPFT